MKLFFTIFGAILAAAAVIYVIAEVQLAQKQHREFMEAVDKVNKSSARLHSETEREAAEDAALTNSTAPAPGLQ